MVLVKTGLLAFAITAPTGNAALGLLILLLFCYFLYGYVTYDGEKPLGLMRLPAHFFLGAILISSFFSIIVKESLIYTLGMALMVYLGLLGGRAAVKERRFFLSFMMPLFLISSCIAALLALYQYFVLDISRTYAFLSYTNRLGALLLFFGFLCSGYLFLHHRWILFPYGALILLAMGTTLSRAAWVGTGAALSIIGLSRRSKGTLIILLLVFLFFGFLFNYQPHWLRRFMSIFRYEQNMDRIELWKAALHIFRDNPITGSGPGTYPLMQEDYREGSRSRSIHASPHNIFLAVLADTGLIGLLALGFLLLQSLYMSILLLKGGDSLDMGLVAALGGILFNEIFSQGLYTMQVGTIIWFALGMLSGLYDRRIIEMQIGQGKEPAIE